ncbi:cysteine peptidase family C39 domain-containing protein [Patescibacteria group bacterium]|nr:cysteine peptidase family C39 domain-containing protein [Patescibacteria group bacterium]
MGRSHVTPIQQPDDTTCGPSALKLALAVLGKRKSLATLIDLCQTNRNGTSTANMVRAINKLGLSVLVVQYATLHHLQSALRYPSNQMRATLVSYLYDLDEKDRPHPDSGHWAVVCAYSARRSRIVLLDSASNKKKSYPWVEFRRRWMDYDLKRKRLKKRGRKFQLVRRWQEQLMLVIAKDPGTLPAFTIDTARLFTPD